MAGKPFAHLLTDPEGYSLAWDGKIDFTQLERLAINDLSAIISGGTDRLKAGDPRTLAATTASFMLAQGLVEFELKDSEQYARYREILQSSDKIIFARYDINNTYSFTADNPQFISNEDKPEVAVRLPSARRWPVEIIGWVAEHHIEAASLVGSIDANAATAILNDFSLRDFYQKTPESD